MSFIDKFNYNRNKIADKISAVSISSDLKGFVDHAYGFRKIHPDYAGYCCRIKRSSDNAEIDVKFDSYNLLSLDSEGFAITSPFASVGSLANWVGSNNGNLTTIYDQGSIGQADSSQIINLEDYTGYEYRGATNQTTTRAATHTDPLIVSGGMLMTNNGVPTAKLTGSGIMSFDGGDESSGEPSGLHSDNGGSSETFLIGMISGTGTDDEGDFTANDTVGGSATQHKINHIMGGRIHNWNDDIQIGEQDDQFVFYYENANTYGNAITGGPVVYNETQLWSSFTNTTEAGFKVKNFRQTGQFNGGATAVTPVGISSARTPKYIGIGGPFFFSPTGTDVGRGEFQELIFSTETLTSAQRLGVESYMSSHYNFFNLDTSALTTQQKISFGFNIFTPTYGAQMSFQSENSSWKGSSFYPFISPRGLNNLQLRSNLSFINNLDNTKKLLNYIENITTGKLTGEEAFTGNVSYLNFGSAKNGTEIAFDTGYYKNFSGSQIMDYTIEDISDDVYKVNVSLFNSTASSTLNNGMAFVSDKTAAISDGNFSKFDVVTGSTTDCNPTVFDNYFYLTADRVNSISASNVSGINTYTGVADDSTRTFFWEPDRVVPLTVNHANRSLNFKDSFTKSLNISDNQNAIARIELSFTNRSEKETYSILHFLESHLGYKHFVYYHDNDVINKNRVFYCPRWAHTLVYKDSNNITATFTAITSPIIPV